MAQKICPKILSTVQQVLVWGGWKEAQFVSAEAVGVLALFGLGSGKVPGVAANWAYVFLARQRGVLRFEVTSDHCPPAA